MREQHTESVETLVCQHKVVVTSAEQRYDSLAGVVCVFFGPDPIQASVTLSYGKLNIEQTTQILEMSPGDICTFVATNIESISLLIEKAATGS